MDAVIYALTVQIKDIISRYGVQTVVGYEWPVYSSGIPEIVIAAGGMLPNGNVLLAASYKDPTMVRILDLETKTLSTSADIPTNNKMMCASVIFEDGALLLAGGTNDAGNIGYNNNTAYMRAPDGVWSRVADLPWVGARMKGTLLDDGTAIVAGGVHHNEPSANVAVYDRATNAWTMKAPLPSARCNQAMVRLPNGNVLVAGGNARKGSVNIDVFDSVYEWNPATNTWIEKAKLPIPLCDSGAIVEPNGDVLLLGGSTTGSDGVTDKLHYYDLSENAWYDSLDRLPSLPGKRCGAVWVKDKNGFYYGIGGSNHYSVKTGTNYAYTDIIEGRPKVDLGQLVDTIQAWSTIH